MIEKLRELDKLQKELEDRSTSLKKEKKDFEDSISDKVTKLKALEKQVKDLKLEIEPLALKESEELGKKTLPTGIVIKSTKSISYPKDKALDFAKDKGLWLTLDKEAFEKSISTLDLDWVEEITTPKVTFPKKLKLEE